MTQFAITSIYDSLYMTQNSNRDLQFNKSNITPRYYNMPNQNNVSAETAHHEGEETQMASYQGSAQILNSISDVQHTLILDDIEPDHIHKNVSITDDRDHPDQIPDKIPDLHSKLPLPDLSVNMYAGIDDPEVAKALDHLSHEGSFGADPYYSSGCGETTQIKPAENLRSLFSVSVANQAPPITTHVSPKDIEQNLHSTRVHRLSQNDNSMPVALAPKVHSPSTPLVPASRYDSHGSHQIYPGKLGELHKDIRHLEQAKLNAQHKLEIARQRSQGVLLAPKPNTLNTGSSFYPNSQTLQSFTYSGGPFAGAYSFSNMGQTMLGHMPQMPVSYQQYPRQSTFASNAPAISNQYFINEAPARTRDSLLHEQNHHNQLNQLSTSTNHLTQIESASSEDDEPLIRRIKKPCVAGSQTFPVGSNITKEPVEMKSPKSDVQVLEGQPTKPSPATVSHSATISASSGPENDTADARSPEVEGISFVLPKYEFLRQPVEEGDEFEVVKVSLPNMVREEMLLSPEHSEQEVQLLLNVFMPNQQALTTPDPAPAVALLNFHTIAVMVIEAYIQYEIGDVQGLGRGHFHQNHDRSNKAYKPTRDAKDAEEDEIFFEVTDRWRAGRESKKPAVQFIRGAQEFCDVALDVIHYIKEHGLFKKPKVQKPRNAANTREDGEHNDEASKGAKRSGSTKQVNELQPRKKSKNEKAPQQKKKPTSGITVIKKK